LTIGYHIGESDILSIAQKRAYRSPLRQQQVAATRERILRTCAELVAQRTSLDVSIPQLARAAEDFAIAGNDYEVVSAYLALAALDREHAARDRAIAARDRAITASMIAATRLTGAPDG